jgi:DNA-binding transcriptional ArsR family regulator
MTPKNPKPLEEVLCSRTRIKMFKLLNDLGQLNVSDIAERLGVNYEYTVANLRILEENDLVKHLRSGRTRYYRLNDGCLRASALKQVFLVWQG